MELPYEKHINDKVILITGGTGSFGNIVTRKLLQYNPKKIIIYSRDEKKQYDMRNNFDDQRLKFVIGDIRDKDSVNRVVKGANYIFHAAALKQVPTCEFFPMEAAKTNVFGTFNVLNAAAHHNVQKVVILSTDKAVYPINAMGMTKALMEKTMISAAKNYPPFENDQTVFCGVRYGNVLYSRGSVLPHFVNLIKQNKKLVITNAKMTRFLLPLPNAVNLVLHALSTGESGCMYVRKSPACTVEVLAQAVCKIFDHKKGYKIVGIRAGEKMHETLVSKEELLRTVDEEEFFKIAPESQGLDYGRYLYRGKKVDIETVEPYTSANTEQLTVQQTVKLLLSLTEIKYELKHHRERRKE